MTWLHPRRPRNETTMTPLTPTTHSEPKLNELDPNDDTVQALTAGTDLEALDGEWR